MIQPSISLGTRQQTSISQRMQQAVKLLQMSALEFQQELLQQLAENPFLEESEAPDTSVADPLDPAAAPLADADDTAVFDHGDTDRDYRLDPEPTVLESQDWNEAPGSAFETLAADGSSFASHDPLQWLHAEASLRSHLFEQLRGACLSERSTLAAGLVIETLDDDGYLREDLAATAEALEMINPLDADELAAGVKVVQQFDPPGIAARDLVECLSLQLTPMPVRTPGRALALKLVDGHLNLLARHDYTSLRRLLDCSSHALTTAHGLIRMLDPKPGARHSRARTEYIEPDVLIAEHRGALTITINPAVLPRAQLNRSCMELMRRSGRGGHTALRQQLQEAQFLLRSAAQRHLTIKRVAEAIVARQRGFFQYGEVALKPLVLREVAEELGLHESTLSRATANKYMATPRGTYEFRHFFSRQLATDTGGTCSAASVRALMKEMIEAESSDAPLSDVLLAQKLSASGICVARRTVAKYRNQMKLPPWELRHLP